MFGLFENKSFAMIIPNQENEVLYALAKDLSKLGAQSVRFVDEQLVDRANNPVYSAIAVVVENMPVRKAAAFLGKFGKTLVKTQKYRYFGKDYDMYV